LGEAGLVIVMLIVESVDAAAAQAQHVMDVMVLMPDMGSREIQKLAHVRHQIGQGHGIAEIGVAQSDQKSALGPSQALVNWPVEIVPTLQV
ncbi:hypothetical protein, partial [Escherichia coli]|uniref:hypothetical protein n=1 Tax=Escherichia coli TaxID=562 RepID=UPI0015C44ACD|nr:hypothetical protein [Escherichia coli]